MIMHRLRRLTAATVLGAGIALGSFSTAFAQAHPLPTAPGADKAVTTGPPPAAPASVPAFGGSPLEPWLIVWLLPLSGILSVAVATAVDRGLRAGRI